MRAQKRARALRGENARLYAAHRSDQKNSSHQHAHQHAHQQPHQQPHQHPRLMSHPFIQSIVVYRVGLRKHLETEMNELGIDEDRCIRSEVVFRYGMRLKWYTIFRVLEPAIYAKIHDFRSMAADEYASFHINDPQRVVENINFLEVLDVSDAPHDAIYAVELPGRLWRKLRSIFAVVFYWYRRAVVVPRFASECFLTWRRMMRNEIDVRVVLDACKQYELDPTQFKPIPLRPLLDPTNEEILALVLGDQRSYYFSLRRERLLRLWTAHRAAWLDVNPYRICKQAFLFYNPRSRHDKFMPNLLEKLLRSCSSDIRDKFPIWTVARGKRRCRRCNP